VYPHRIRLRGPWTCQPLQHCPRSTADLPPAFRIIMPGLWSDGPAPEFRGIACFSRRFGYPGRIDTSERVWLTLDGIVGHAAVALNGSPVGSLDGTGEFDITGLLQPRNLLEATIESRWSPGGILRDVALEVRALAFLRDVTFTCCAGRLEASGQVVGQSERPLELYLIVGRRCAAYATTLPAADGKPFTLVAESTEVPGDASVPMRIELIDAASVWYVAHAPGSIDQTIAGADSSNE
jgi:hypothetical protein